MFSRPVVDLAAVDDALRGLLDRHLDRRRVVHRRDDQVDHREDPVRIRLVVVDQRAARRLDDADAFGRRRPRQLPDDRAQDLGVVRQGLDGLGGLQGLDEPRPVRGQRAVHGLAAQDLEELLVVRLRQRRRHAVGHVEPRERRHAVEAAVRAVHEALPARRLEERELDVRPRLDVLGDVLEVVLRRELRQALARRIDHAQVAAVEVDLPVGVDHAHVVRLVGVVVGEDRVHVRLVAQDDVVEGLQGELREVDEVLARPP